MRAEAGECGRQVFFYYLAGERHHVVRMPPAAPAEAHACNGNAIPSLINTSVFIL